jgi:hypothetical protein
MSALSATTEVPVATIKYYLREGLLVPSLQASDSTNISVRCMASTISMRRPPAWLPKCGQSLRRLRHSRTQMRSKLQSLTPSKPVWTPPRCKWAKTKVELEDAERQLNLARLRDERLDRAAARLQERAQVDEAQAQLLRRLGELLGERLSADRAIEVLDQRFQSARSNLEAFGSNSSLSPNEGKISNAIWPVSKRQRVSARPADAPSTTRRESTPTRSGESNWQNSTSVKPPHARPNPTQSNDCLH